MAAAITEGVVSFGVQKLLELLSRESDGLQGVHEQADGLKRQVEALQSLLEDAEAKKHEDKRVRNFLENVNDIVYDAEDVIESFLLKEIKEKGIKKRVKRLYSFLVDRRKFATDIEGITERISTAIAQLHNFGIIQKIDGGRSLSLQRVRQMSLQRVRQKVIQREIRETFPESSKKGLVGVEQSVEELVDHLVENDNIQMVSISGMGGIGKTTLARQVFHHDIVRRHFDGFAWVCVSQEFTRMDIWQRILQDLRPHDGDIKHMDAHTLQAKLFQLLETSRSLIVLDDVWKNEHWDHIKAVFPQERGSKIILTSRNEGVGLHADPKCFAFRPRILTPEESWNLCESIVFPRRDEIGFSVDEDFLQVNIICEESVRYSFVSHLAAALRRQGISVSVFTDSDPYDQNQEASVSVVVLSQTYALSVPWFDKFIKRQRNNGYVMIPVLYGVGPSAVNPNYDWLQIGNFAGDHQIKNSSNVIQSDSDLVEQIVRYVYGKLSSTERIGIYSRLLEIENLLCEQPWDVRTLGIWGMPGIGKTTLAKAVFGQMSNDYDASCFIENFDESLHKVGPYRLLEEKIGKILKEKFGVSGSYITRLSLPRDKLCDTRILVVLDDVRDSLAAESFLRRLDWFCPGSLIIITSRYKQVFSLCQVNHIYKVQGLNEHEALQLFSQIAFQKDVPEQNDRELSVKVIDYADGNPLALRIYGQELKGKKSEMEAAFLELKQCPPQKIHDRLKSVYSALGDNEKYIFLDIACFFKGENVDYAVQLLNGCGYFPRVGIDVLVEKCLVTISENTLQMNELIQDIILKIISGERIQMEKCATLWQPSSIRYLLEDDEFKANEEPRETPKCVLAVEDIIGVSLDTSNLIFDVNPDAFKNMASLRFLKVYNSYSKHVLGLNFPKGLNSLPSELRFLHWENYPFESLIQGFDLRELVELNMPYSHLKKLRARTKNLEKLKRIRLCHSQQLVKFSIHGYAQNIELIDLQGCTSLESFPAMAKLQDLRVLNLSGCRNIKVVPGLPPNIEELYLQGTSIEELPISTVTHSSQVKPNCKELMNHLKYFPGLEHIDLESVTNLIKVSSYNQGIDKLVRLDMKDCFNLQSLPDMFNLESLQALDLSSCYRLEKIKGFPRNMKELYLAGTAIRELPKLPESLEFLNAHNCDHLKSVCLDFEQLPRHYTFSNCFSLSSETTVEFMAKGLTRVIRLAGQQNQEHIKAPAFNICFPADVCPWSSFHSQGAGSSITVELAPYARKDISGFAMSVVVSFMDDCHNALGLGIRCICLWETKKGQFDRKERVFKCWAPTEAPRVERDHLFVLYDAEMNPGTGERMDQNMSAEKLIFEYHTVSGANMLLGANCLVTKCDVKVIVDSKGDTSFGAISRASEDIGITDELPPPLPKKPEAKLCSPPSSKPHKLSTVTSKIKSKRNVFSRWVGCVPQVRKIKRDNHKGITDRVLHETRTADITG